MKWCSAGLRVEFLHSLGNCGVRENRFRSKPKCADLLERHLDTPPQRIGRHHLWDRGIWVRCLLVYFVWRSSCTRTFPIRQSGGSFLL